MLFVNLRDKPCMGIETTQYWSSYLSLEKLLEIVSEVQKYAEICEELKHFSYSFPKALNLIALS